MLIYYIAAVLPVAEIYGLSPDLDDGLKYPQPYSVSEYIIKLTRRITTARFCLMVGGSIFTTHVNATKEHDNAVGSWHKWQELWAGGIIPHRT